MIPKRMVELPRPLPSANEFEQIPVFENKIVEVSTEKADSDIWLTAKEAADYLRLNVASVRNMTSNGQVPYYKLVGRVRYLKSELRALLKANKRGV